MIPPNASLVKYDSAVLVSRHTDKKTSRARNLRTATSPPICAGPVPSPPPKQKLPIAESKVAQQTDEVLNSILPPREWTENGQLWVQQVSSTPATRLDVVTLQEELDRRLQQRQARETGICAVRRELYSQCFDELIRQVTINCSERGLLLLRVRDEILILCCPLMTPVKSPLMNLTSRMTQCVHYHSDLSLSIIPPISIEGLELEKRELERQVNELKAKCEQIEKRAAEQRMVEEKKHADESNFLKRTIAQLKTQLEGITTPKK
ncbi:33 kDa inner dynein arm light chain, axonemal [Octopus bimaculoides]|uniref:33 kDa inner dynein arm light chain, axonemal n=1 Tax=Octopus bimaculoides TaxID=37653 RepID=UPI00071C909F|nr:33 kDa inner dynein arm light chain, axonemal [Octopus bimaculoides]|eukprot:XP_014779293.1 PREDICTED: 33 kDa inner dynein arm light chain, axonemal-like [Octopus bimaculoides]